MIIDNRGSYPHARVGPCADDILPGQVHELSGGVGCMPRRLKLLAGDLKCQAGFLAGDFRELGRKVAQREELRDSLDAHTCKDRQAFVVSKPINVSDSSIILLNLTN